MKAFLCHASEDKGYIGEVARILGREYVVFDAYSFDDGEEFKSEILKGLGKSKVFVFFVSQIALKKIWVNFELEEAQRRLLEKDLAKALCIRIDKTIEVDQLPRWLTSAKCPLIESPSAAARTIRTHLNKVRSGGIPNLLIGRAADVELVEKRLAPVSEHRPPGMIVLWGLPGIGRRSIASKIVRDVFDLERVLPVFVESGDIAADLRIKLADLLDDAKTEADFLALQRTAERATTAENVSECLSYFSRAADTRELLILVDQGGMLDDQGELLPDFADLLRSIYRAETIRTIVVSRRRPLPFELEPGLPLPSARINRLSDDSIGILLRQLLSLDHITLSPKEVVQLTDRIKGYAPAAYHAVDLVREYGRELILRDGKPITDFRATSFLRFLQKENKFSALEERILEVLSAFDALPLPVLGGALSSDQAETDKAATKLLDLAILEIDRDGYFAVSEPIRDVVYRVFGKLALPYEAVADAIDDYLAFRETDEDDRSRSLTLLRAKYKAYVLAGRPRLKLFHVASDLARLQLAYYHDEEYPRSIEFGLEALAIRANQLGVLNHIARAQAHLEKVDDAKATIEKIRPLSMKDAKFCTGFLMRKQGQMPQAIEAYSQALALGMRGVAIHRELGTCLFDAGRYDEARKHLEQARQADPDNKYLLDYDVKVAIAEGRYDDASESLKLLREVEDDMRYYHRQSTLELARGDVLDAFASAKLAMDSSTRPQFEVIAQYVISGIRAKQLTEAEEGLGLLSRRFPSIRMDIQNGLWARYHLAKGQLEDADIFWQRIKKKHTAMHEKIRFDILVETVRAGLLNAAARQIAQKEIDKLSSSLGAKKPDLEFL